MPILIDAEAICHHCGAKVACKLDVDLLISRRASSPGSAIRGLEWLYKEGGQSLACTDNLACSEKCATALSKTSSYRGEWKRCGTLGPL